MDFIPWGKAIIFLKDAVSFGIQKKLVFYHQTGHIYNPLRIQLHAKKTFKHDLHLDTSLVILTLCKKRIIRIFCLIN